jgi:hypothetical protein
MEVCSTAQAGAHTGASEGLTFAEYEILLMSFSGIEMGNV